MNQATAANVVAAVVNAGYSVRAYIRADGQWVVHVFSNSFNIPVATADSFGTSEGVSGNINEIEYV